MKMDGKTQQEIADHLGYKNHSAVTKRIKKLKELFLECA
jgi:DNA-binding MarR family transcriptional regulator